MNSARFVDIETANPPSEARGRVVVETSRLLDTENTRKIPYVKQAPVLGYDEEDERDFNPGRVSKYLKFPKHERHIQAPHGKGNSPPSRLKTPMESNMLFKDSSLSQRYWDSEKLIKDPGNYKFKDSSSSKRHWDKEKYIEDPGNYESKVYSSSKRYWDSEKFIEDQGNCESKDFNTRKRYWESDGSPYCEQIEPENLGYPELMKRGKFHQKEQLDADNFFSYKGSLRAPHIYKEQVEHEKHRYSEPNDRDEYYKMQIEGTEPESYHFRNKMLPESYGFPEGKDRSRVLIEQLIRRNEYYPNVNNRYKYPYGKQVEPGSYYFREVNEPHEHFYSESDYYPRNYHYYESNDRHVRERRVQSYPFKEHEEPESYRASYEDLFERNRHGYPRNPLIEPEKPMHHSLLRSGKYQEHIFARFSPDDISRLSNDEHPHLFRASQQNRRVSYLTSPYEHEDLSYDDRRSNPRFLRPQSGKRETIYEPHKRIRKDELSTPMRSSEEAYESERFDLDEETMNYDDNSYYEGHDSPQIRFKPKRRTKTGQLVVFKYPDTVEAEWAPEPSESSEEFKQKVDKAFLLYSKSLNISQSVRRKYLMRGKAGSLHCIVCRRLPNEFPDTEALAKHALVSREADHRADHQALHKAICLIMGWDTCHPSKPSEWAPVPLSLSEAWARREDLILWPPIVIVRNLPFSITPPEKISSILRGKGLINGKLTVSLGQPADQTVILLKFLGTFTGLDSAERVNRYFGDNYRGRGKYHVRVKGGGGSKRTECEDENMYGYMGTASDMELLDGKTRMLVTIRSKKGIMDLANEPVRPITTP